MSRFSIFGFLFLSSLALRAQDAGNVATLTPVASFPNEQVTGVAVSRSGRIFVNFPDWADPHGLSVAEVGGGKPRPSE